jgi:transposase
MQPILAIDLGKNKSVFCDYDPRNGQHAFGTLPTTPKDVHDLLVTYPGHLVVIEICPLAGWVSDLCRTLGLTLKVVNTTSEQWSWKKVKNKSDRSDALKIAMMQAMGQHRYVHVPAPAVRQWRELISYRDGQVSRATASKNKIRAILDRQGQRWPAGKRGWTAAALAELATMARPLAECDEATALWRGMLHEELASLNHTLERVAEVTKKLDGLAETNDRVRRLKTVPAVGNRTAEITIAMIDDPRRFGNVSQAGAYTGLTPRRLQSGEMDRQVGISHAGSRLLRKMLVQAAWVGQQTNPWMQETFARVCGGKKDRRKKAIVAVARQLFVRLWAMDRDGKDWSGPAAMKPPMRRRTIRTAAAATTRTTRTTKPTKTKLPGVRRGSRASQVALGALPQTPPR